MIEKPLAEITLRKYEKPFRLSGRELVKKLCLSMGLLQPGDGRDVVVDVLHTFLKEKEKISAKDIELTVKKTRDEAGLPLKGITGSNIRRQIKRLRDLYLVEKIGTSYRIAEGEALPELFSAKIEKFYLSSIVSRVSEYLEAVEKERWKHE
ncbi:hypothetical protein KY329_00705 [Candidatus Woesearchaeota archaeon]|nr:hypothetical protein [Candidatus Woesearchaeota archaeon]